MFDLGRKEVIVHDVSAFLWSDRSICLETAAWYNQSYQCFDLLIIALKPGT